MEARSLIRRLAHARAAGVAEAERRDDCVLKRGEGSSEFVRRAGWSDERRYVAGVKVRDVRCGDVCCGDVCCGELIAVCEEGVDHIEHGGAGFCLEDGFAEVPAAGD